MTTLPANSDATSFGKQNGILKQIAIGMLVAFVVVIFALTPWGLKVEQEIGLGWLFVVRGPVEPPPDVIIVSMDSESADMLGQSTRLRRWDRALHAELIERLVQRGAAAIVFDILFESTRDVAEDEKLIDSIKRSRRTVLSQMILRKESKQIVSTTLVSPAGEYAISPIGLAPFPLPKTSNRVSQYWLFHDGTGDRATLPLVALQVQVINVVGYDRFIKFLDRAQIIASIELPASIDRAAHTQNLILKLKVAFSQNPGSVHRYMALLENEAFALSPAELRVMRALGSAYNTSTSSNHVNFYGPPRTMTTIPYHAFWDVDNPLAVPHDLQNAVVFVGASSRLPSSQQDGFLTVYSTPDGLDLEGVEIAASIVGNLLDQSRLSRLDIVITLVVVFIFGLLVSILALRIPGIKGAVVIILIGTCYLIAAERLFTISHVWLPLFIPLAIQLPVAVIAGLLWHYFSVRNARESITAAMGRYVPQSIVEQIAKDGDHHSKDSEIINACCLCSDVQGYTTLSERLPPERLNQLTNEYFSYVGECMKERNGEVMNFVGDGATCIWKGSEPTEPTRLQASLAALDILERVQEFNEKHPNEIFQTRIGLHIGPVVIGDTGGGGHFNYGIQGDTINASSRIEQLNKKLGTLLLASEAVARDLDTLLMRRVGDFVLKGKTEVLTIVEIVTQREKATKNQYDLCERFGNAMEQFDQQRWAEASRLFAQLLERFPQDGPALFYQRQCREYLANPVNSNRNSVIRLEAE